MESRGNLSDLGARNGQQWGAIPGQLVNQVDTDTDSQSTTRQPVDLCRGGPCYC